MRQFICGLLATMLLGMGLGCSASIEADPFQGNWEGKFIGETMKDTPILAKIIAQGRGKYRAILSIDKTTGEIQGKMKGKKAVFDGTIDLGSGSAELKMKASEDLIIKGKYGSATFEMKHVEKQSPTLGQTPPTGAIVLFDGKSLDAWQPTNPANSKTWKIVDNVMQVRKGGNQMSKQTFGDAQYHVEFRTPLMADKRGQARGNSGVYILGRYEVQVLDSYGLPTADNECGGIYKKAVPKTNACLPPMEWQTYDITFHTAKFDETGKKVRNAIITVVQNGVTIHDNVELDSPTPGGVSGEDAKEGPLMLQDHNCPVQYRNIWVKPL